MECPSLSESGSAGVLSSNSAQKRPMNAFLIFCKRHRSVVRERYPHLENRAITRILGEWWASLSSEDKRDYTELAKKYKEHFMLMNPNFKWYKTAELNRPPQSNSPPPPVPNAESQPLIDDILESQAAAAKPSSPSSGSSITNENTLADGSAREPNCAPKPLKKRYLENGEFKAGCTQNSKQNNNPTNVSSPQQPKLATSDATNSTAPSSAAHSKASSISSTSSKSAATADEIACAGPPILDLETANRVIENALSGAVQNALQGLNNDFNSELISHRVNSVRELIDATNSTTTTNGPTAASHSLDLSRSSTITTTSTTTAAASAGAKAHNNHSPVDLKLQQQSSSRADSDTESDSSSRDSVPNSSNKQQTLNHANNIKSSSGTATPANNASDGEARLSARSSPGVVSGHNDNNSFHHQVEAKPLAQSPPPPYAVVKGPSIFANSTSSILETVASFSRKVDKTPAALSRHDNDPDKPLNLSASKVLTASNQHIIDHFIDKLLTASNTQAGNPMPKELTSLSSPSSPPIEGAATGSAAHSGSPSKASNLTRSVDDSNMNNSNLKKSDGGKKSERTCKGKRYAELVRDGKLGKPNNSNNKSSNQTDSDHEGKNNNVENQQSKWVTGGFDLEKHIAQLPQLGDAQLLDALSNSKSVAPNKTAAGVSAGGHGSGASGKSTMPSETSGETNSDRDRWQPQQQQQRGSTSSTAQLASDYLHDTIVNEIKRKPSDGPNKVTANLQHPQQQPTPPAVTSGSGGAGIVTAAEVVERVRAAQAAAAAAAASKSPSHQSSSDLKRGQQSQSPPAHSYHSGMNGGGGQTAKRLRISSDESDETATNNTRCYIDGEGNRSATNSISPRLGTQLNNHQQLENPGTSNSNVNVNALNCSSNGPPLPPVSEPIECDGLAALAEVALLQARNSLAS